MSKRLLPLIPTGLSVAQVLPAPERVVIVIRPQSATAACPDCGTLSCRAQSYYERTSCDLPWQGRPVRLRVQARRFRCLTPSCQRRTFAERLTDVAAVAARRTERLGGLQRHLGLALGGEAGARLAERLAMHTSPDTLLRLVRSAGAVADPLPTPRVLAVDDWPWSRATACRRVKEVLSTAGIGGLHATPKGLRHGLGVNAVGQGVPLNLVQRWLGHARLSTTAIYAEAVVEEERTIAACKWT